MDRNLNICILSQEFPPYTNWGGIATYNSELARIYADMGHDVTIISRHAKGAPKFEQQGNGVKVWRIRPSIFRKYFVGRTVDRILFSKKVCNKVMQLDQITPFDLIETSEASLEGEALLQDPRMCKKMIIQCNGSNAFGVVPGGPLSFLHWLDWKWSFKREQLSLKIVPRIIVTSSATRDFLISQDVDCNKIKSIYQGIDAARFKPLTESLPKFPLMVGFAGRLENRKGIDFIWKVMDEIGPDAGIKFHFKGKVHPTISQEVEDNLKKYSDFSSYHPPGNHSEMYEYYQSLHVLLQPSRFENFGLVYAEALATGLIVFAGKGGSGPEVVTDNVTGFIIDPDNDKVDFVVSKLKEISANPSAFKNMKCNARRDVVERFSLQSCAAKKIAFYKDYL